LSVVVSDYACALATCDFTLDLFPSVQMAQPDSLLSLLVFSLFPVSSVGWFVCGCELSLAPNNSPLPPVTLFLGIRSSNRMPEGRFGPGLARPEALAVIFALRVTRGV